MPALSDELQNSTDTFQAYQVGGAKLFFNPEGAFFILCFPLEPGQCCKFCLPIKFARNHTVEEKQMTYGGGEGSQTATNASEREDISDDADTDYEMEMGTGNPLAFLVCGKPKWCMLSFETKNRLRLHERQFDQLLCLSPAQSVRGRLNVKSSNSTCISEF